MKLLFLTIAVKLLVLTVSADYDSIEPTTTATVDTNAEAIAVADTTSNDSSKSDSKLTSSTGSSSDKPRTASKVYKSCVTTCPKTCSNPEPKFCSMICKPGWQCPNDYYLNSADKCVVREDCDDNNSQQSEPVQAPGPVISPLPMPDGPKPGFRPIPIMHRPYPGFRPIRRPRPSSGDFGGFQNPPDFQSPDGFNYQGPKITLPMGPPRPRPTFQIDPIEYNSTSVANGDPIPPPAVVRTTGSNAPFISRPSIVPKNKFIIDLDPTVPRPRINQEESSDDDVQSKS